MGSLYLNKLSPDQHDELERILLTGQHGNCFICGKEIDLDAHGGHVDIDHIEPTKLGGKDSPENFALTHESCNRSKQASDLRVARILAAFDVIAESVGENRAPNLGDILLEHGGSKFDLSGKIVDGHLKTSLPDIGKNDILTLPVYRDALSGFDYTFAVLPIEYLHHDDHINPRGIGSNLKKLIEEFHRKLPQLHIALGWIDTSDPRSIRVRVFDGQHKAAAQVLLGVKHLPIRIFINPDHDILLTANTHAGTTLRQVAFDKSVQRGLGSSLLADRMDRIRHDCNLAEDDESFSERSLVNHFRGESREMKRYVLDWVRNSVTTHNDNKLRDYIDYAGRGSEMPLSYSTIEKTFYSFFIYGDLLTTPFNYRVDSGENPRRLEIDQIVRLMNIIADRIFIGQYDHAIGTRRIENNLQRGKDVPPEPHLRAYRMAKEEIIYNWLRYIRQIVQMYFISTGKPIDEDKLFQYAIPEACWTNIENFIEGLKRLSLWVNKDLSNSVFGGKHNYDFWQSIFERGTTPDGQTVMPQGIDIMSMIRSSETAVA